MWLMVYWADLPQNTVNILRPHSHIPAPISCTHAEMCMTDCVLFCATAVGEVTNDTAVNGRHNGRGNTRLQSIRQPRNLASNWPHILCKLGGLMAYGFSGRATHKSFTASDPVK